MAQSPKYKIYRGKEYIGSAKEATDAAMFVATQGEGSTIRLSHSYVLWTEGADGNAGDSYDRAAETIWAREREVHRKAHTKQYGTP